MGVPFDIYIMAKASDFKFSTQLLGSPRPIIKSNTKEKLNVYLYYRSFPKLGVPL